MPLLLPACSPVSVLNATTPSGGLARRTGLSYGPDPRQTLDIYAPAEASDAPVVVFFYGGGWTDGNRGDYRFVGAALAALGFVCVVPDYRLYPQVRYPDFLRDCAAAVAWTRANAASHGGDPRRIALLGHSAGAYNAAMLTLDRQWLVAEGLDPDRDLVAMAGLSGPYDFLPLVDPELQAIFAPAGDLRLSQPIHYARGNALPLFLATGTSDTTVLPRNTRHLAEAVRGAGGRVETRYYQGLGHKLMIGAFASLLRWYAPVLRDVGQFLDAPALPRQAVAAE
jgi:acetyl esterase/lipase